MKKDHRSKFSNLSSWKEEAWKKSRWGPDFFQASSFQLLKLENLLSWSFLTFIYNRSTIYEFFHITTSHQELVSLTSTSECRDVLEKLNYTTPPAEVVFEHCEKPGRVFFLALWLVASGHLIILENSRLTRQLPYDLSLQTQIVHFFPVLLFWYLTNWRQFFMRLSCYWS